MVLIKVFVQIVSMASSSMGGYMWKHYLQNSEMEGTNALLANLVQTKSIERVLAPIANQVNHVNTGIELTDLLRVLVYMYGIHISWCSVGYKCQHINPVLQSQVLYKRRGVGGRWGGGGGGGVWVGGGGQLGMLEQLGAAANLTISSDLAIVAKLGDLKCL